MGAVSVNLGFKKDTGRYLVGDRGGREYWFDKGKLEAWSVERDGLEVRIDEAAWERRVRADRAEPEVKVHKMRKCLRCKREFGAARYMFVCDPCKQTASWQEGTTIFCQ